MNLLLTGDTQTDKAIINLCEQLSAFITAGSTPTGSIVAFSGDVAPTGWLICNGTEYLRTDYPELFAVIGIMYGASSRNVFAVPDYRGHFLRGTGTHGTAAKAAGGNFSGPALGSRENDAVQGHLHDLADKWILELNAGTYFFAGSATYSYTSEGATGTPYTDGVNGTPRTGNETKPANYGVNYIIRA